MKFKATYLYRGLWDDKSKHVCFHWSVLINNEEFRHHLGLAHVDKRGNPLPPKHDEVLYCLLGDEGCAKDTFPDFCANFGYDVDSRKALETYLACQENGRKLRKALGKEYDEVKKRIEGIEL